MLIWDSPYRVKTMLFGNQFHCLRCWIHVDSSKTVRRRNFVNCRVAVNMEFPRFPSFDRKFLAPRCKRSWCAACFSPPNWPLSESNRHRVHCLGMVLCTKHGLAEWWNTLNQFMLLMQRIYNHSCVGMCQFVFLVLEWCCSTKYRVEWMNVNVQNDWFQQQCLPKKEIWHSPESHSLLCERLCVESQEPFGGSHSRTPIDLRNVLALGVNLFCFMCFILLEKA